MAGRIRSNVEHNGQRLARGGAARGATRTQREDVSCKHRYARIAKSLVPIYLVNRSSIDAFDAAE